MVKAIQRNPSIDILKFFAALLITNSHMDMLYAKYGALATGGSIGDALFFFCSGFTLFLGRMGRFDNWYKRRINRIYPTVFAIAIVSSCIFGVQNDMKNVLQSGGGWFVSCIMIYYVLLYPINRYFRNHLIWVYVTAALVVIVRYLTMERPDTYDMSGNIGYFKWLFFFLIMLMGAMMGISQKKWNFNLKWDTVKLLLSIVAFYAIYAPCKKIPVINDYQLFALIPLHFVVLYFYKVCNSDLLKRIYEHRIIGWCIKAVGGLCLEIYLIQNYLFTDKMNHLFPLNIFIMFFLIFISAYGLRCVSCIFAQTFKDGEYDWKAVVKIV